MGFVLGEAIQQLHPGLQQCGPNCPARSSEIRYPDKLPFPVEHGGGIL